MASRGQLRLQLAQALEERDALAVRLMESTKELAQHGPKCGYPRPGPLRKLFDAAWLWWARRVA